MGMVKGINPVIQLRRKGDNWVDSYNDESMQIYNSINELIKRLTNLKEVLIIDHQLKSYIKEDNYINDLFDIHRIIIELRATLSDDYTKYLTRSNEKFIQLIDLIMNELQQFVINILDEMHKLKEYSINPTIKQSYKIIAGIVYSIKTPSSDKCIEEISIMQLLLKDTEKLLQSILCNIQF